MFIFVNAHQLGGNKDIYIPTGIGTVSIQYKIDIDLII